MMLYKCIRCIFFSNFFSSCFKCDKKQPSNTYYLEGILKWYASLESGLNESVKFFEINVAAACTDSHVSSN